MNKVLVAILIVLSTVILVGGVFTYSLVTKEKVVTTTYDPGDEFLTNLSDDKSYIKVDLILELANKKSLKSMEGDNCKIRDAIIAVLRKKSPAELNQEDGFKNLKNDIIKSLNDFFGADAFINVYFEEFIVQ